MSAPVKLTKAEGIALADALAARVGHANVLLALVSAIGAERATGIVERQEGRISKAETVALVKAIIPLIPGDTLKAKIKVAIACLREAIPDKARADEILAYVLQKIKDYKVPPVVQPIAPIVNDGFLRFYGRVNMWCAGGEDLLRKDVTLCAALGVGYQIEMAGWNPGQTVFDSHLNLSMTLEMYRKLHGWCKTAGIPLFVSITNWNITLSKYGNKGRPFASIVDVAKQLAQCVKDCGGQDFVYVQPVAETGNDKSATDFEKWCGEFFKGWKLVYNGGSRPTKPAYGWPHFAVHPNKATDGGVKGCISISDTGTIIKQLSADGSLNGPGDPAKIASWFAKCKASGAIGAGYYAFQREKHDAEAIKACAGVNAPVNQPEPVNGSILPSQVKWLGTNYANAKTTVTLSGVSMSGTHLNFKATPTPPWPPYGAKKCRAVGFLIRKINGKYVGGKVEWCVVERGWYDIKTNTLDGYNGSTVPANGETCWAGLGHTTNGSEVSTLVPFIWKA